MVRCSVNLFWKICRFLWVFDDVLHCSCVLHLPSLQCVLERHDQAMQGVSVWDLLVVRGGDHRHRCPRGGLGGTSKSNHGQPVCEPKHLLFDGKLPVVERCPVGLRAVRQNIGQGLSCPPLLRACRRAGGVTHSTRKGAFQIGAPSARLDRSIEHRGAGWVQGSNVPDQYDEFAFYMH